MEENVTNLAAKAQLQKLMGNTADATETTKKMMALAANENEVKLNVFGYELMSENDMPAALEIFKLNIKNHPDSWNTYDSMGEAYGKAGDKMQALTNYKTALSMAPEDQKACIKNIIADMQKS